MPAVHRQIHAALDIPWAPGVSCQRPGAKHVSQSPLIIVFIVAVVAVIVMAVLSSAKRRKELMAWANSRRLTFAPGKDHNMDSRFGAFKCLHCGDSRYAYNVITGDWKGLPFVGFDYHYETGSGKNRSTHTFSAVVLGSPVPLKPLYIRREGFFDKITEFFGLDDIDFESAEFSRKFYVKAQDKRWAYDVIHQRMMEYLLLAPEFTLQFDFGAVIAWRDQLFGVDKFESAAELIRGMYDRLPDYVVKQQTQGTR